MNLQTVVVLLLTAVVTGACLCDLLGRLSGRRSCCGQRTARVKKKKLCSPAGKCYVKIEGLRCASCCRTLTARLNALEGISARVSLEKRMAVITYEAPPSDEKIVEAVEAAGFAVAEIRRP